MRQLLFEIRGQVRYEPIFAMEIAYSDSRGKPYSYIHKSYYTIINPVSDNHSKTWVLETTTRNIIKDDDFNLSEKEFNNHEHLSSIEYGYLWDLSDLLPRDKLLIDLLELKKNDPTLYDSYLVRTISDLNMDLKTPKGHVPYLNDSLLLHCVDSFGNVISEDFIRKTQLKLGFSLRSKYPYSNIINEEEIIYPILKSVATQVTVYITKFLLSQVSSSDVTNVTKINYLEIKNYLDNGHKEIMGLLFSNDLTKEDTE